MTRKDAVVRAAALLAVICGGVDLAWRAVVMWQGHGPTLFMVLYVCEFLVWAVLVSFCYLAWRTPRVGRLAIGLPHAVDVAVGNRDESVDVLPSVTAPRSDPSPSPEHGDPESVEQLLVAAQAAAG